MVRFTDWCRSEDASIGNHRLRVLTGKPAKLTAGIEATAAVVPGHYAAEEQIARVLDRLGKPAAAALVRNKLPTTKGMRSGDLGEIFATEWIDAHSGYFAPVKRLRWKDHRDMPMRGDDVIAIRTDPRSQRLRFLKAEAKSRVRLTVRVLTDARDGLDKNHGCPSEHSLAFVSARLVDLGDLPLADAIDEAQLKLGIPTEHVRHLLFTFSDNAPDALLTGSLQDYKGAVPQWAVGLRVEGHVGFVGAVYERVIANANNA